MSLHVTLEEKRKNTNVATREKEKGQVVNQETQAAKLINQETRERKLFERVCGFLKWHMVSLSSLDPKSSQRKYISRQQNT